MQEKNLSQPGFTLLTHHPRHEIRIKNNLEKNDKS